MRLVSQDGEIDVSYEHGSLCIGFIKGEEHIINTISYYNYSSQKGTKLAEYSSKNKCLKAMEMLRDAFAGKFVFKNVDLDDSVFELLKEWKSKGIVVKTNDDTQDVQYINNAIFQFPQDEEIEV